MERIYSSKYVQCYLFMYDILNHIPLLKMKLYYIMILKDNHGESFEIYISMAEIFDDFDDNKKYIYLHS